jgi:hypothetical protein
MKSYRIARIAGDGIGNDWKMNTGTGSGIPAGGPRGARAARSSLQGAP